LATGIDLLVDDLAGNIDRLFRLALIVQQHRFQLLAVDPALGVELFDRHFGPGHLHIAILGDIAGDRAGDRNLDGLLGIGQAAQAQNSCANGGAEDSAVKGIHRDFAPRKAGFGRVNAPQMGFESIRSS